MTNDQHSKALIEGDIAFMQRALDLAAKGINTTTPNPRVGCVIVSADGEIVGEGFHAKAGCGHAEVEAIKAAGGRTQGCTAYVTLEPCNHRGRTGPCTEALIDAGIKHVVYGMQDPNPQVAGTGLARLNKAGITCSGPILEAQAKALNVGYIKRMTQGRPFVRCKLAMSLDGRTAMASGESQWITGECAREDVQSLRARACAIVTGVDSVIYDDPSLTVRSERFGASPRQPLRIVIDSQLRTPESAKILNLPGQTLVATTQESAGIKQLDHAELQPLPSRAGKVCLESLLGFLGEKGCNEVLVETGAKLAGAFLEKGLVDELVIYVAGKIMGSAARPLFDLPLESMSQAIDLNIQTIEPCGEDWKITAVPSTDLRTAEGV